jgi:tRNA nucleotidyltransferase/poly(A) polymerase
VRIAATFDFALDEATEAAIVEMAATIVVVSPERIAQEMRKVLETDHRRRGIELLARTRLLETLLPEVEPLRLAHEANPANSAWSRTLATLESLEQPGFPLALAALLSHAGAANDPRNPAEAVPVATAIARRWRLSNKEADRVAWLLTHRHGLRQVSSLPWSRWQRLLVTDGVEELLALDEAACRAEGHDVKHLELCRERLRLPAEQLNPAPLLDGRDLLAHGVPQGEIFRRLLDAARDAQLDGQIRTKAEALALVDRLRKGATPC